MSTFGSIWRKRSSTGTGPMSGEQIDQIAPRLALARKATAAAGVFGGMAQTRSPGATPSFRKAAASAATCRRSAGHGLVDEHGRMRRRRFDAAVVPDRLPEGAKLGA